MTLLDIIKVADAAYPDGLVMQAHKEGRKFQGDTLAEFIARELEDTSDRKANDTEQLYDAHRVMARATWELQQVTWKLARVVPKKAT